MTALVALSMLTACSKDDDGPAADCFDCTISGQTSRYCYVEGRDYYSVTIGGQVLEVDFQEGQTWEDTKAGLELGCDE